jgi:hypothetical protein
MSEQIRDRIASTPTPTPTPTPTEEDVWRDQRTNKEWAVSFAAMMVPFLGFCYGHSRGATGRAVEAVVRSPLGVYGLLALPFCTLAVEKCIYDTVQAAQGIDPNVRPKDRGGFPSGGAELPSFSLIAVRR